MPQAQVQTLVYCREWESVPLKKQWQCAKSMLSQSTFFFIHLNCQTAGYTYKYTFFFLLRSLVGWALLLLHLTSWVFYGRLICIWNHHSQTKINFLARLLSTVSPLYSKAFRNSFQAGSYVRVLNNLYAHILIVPCLKPHFGLFISKDFSLTVVHT